MANYTHSTLEAQSGNLKFIISSFAIITVLINIVVFVLGMKTLKKNTHNLFVISMCGGDCLYGLSLFILVFVSRLSPSYTDLCLSQIIIYFISVSVSLTVALLICIERYVTIRLNNYGHLTHSDLWKKKLAAVLWILTTGYVIICLLVVPRHKNNMDICYFEHFYTPYNYRVIMALLSSLFASMTLITVVLYVLIICILFNLIKLKTKVAPIAQVPCKETVNIQSERLEDTFSNDYLKTASDIPSTSRNMVDKAQNNETETRFSKENTEHKTNINIPGKRAGFRCISLDSGINISIVSKTVWQSATDIVNNEENPIRREQSGSKTCERGRSQALSNKQRSLQKENQTISALKKWELRALATSCYIIGSATLLHGPLVLCMIFDALGVPVDNSIGSISALLLALRCVIDPFIYAFRFKELREAIKNCICCRKDNEMQDFPQENAQEIVERTVRKL